MIKVPRREQVQTFCETREDKPQDPSSKL